jgi:hypothetical protein
MTLTGYQLTNDHVGTQEFVRFCRLVCRDDARLGFYTVFQRRIIAGITMASMAGQ